MAKVLVETLAADSRSRRRKEADKLPALHRTRGTSRIGSARLVTSAATFREMIEARVQNRPKSAKPLAPPPRGSEIDLLAVLQECIRESAEKRKKTPGRPAAARRVTPSVKTKRRTGSLGNN